MKKHKRPKVAFVGWNPFQFLHFTKIAALFPKAVYIIEERDGARGCFDFENLPGAPSKVLRLDRKAMGKIDGRFDVLVCQSPFEGIEAIRISRIAMLQSSYARETHNFAPWRSFADVCLTFGNHASQKIEPFAPCVAVGNPRYEDWSKPEFVQQAVGKYASRLDPAKKTILYAPSWGEHSSLETFSDALSELSRSHNLIVKIHHNSQLEGRNFTESIRKRFKIVCDVRDDIVELLAVSDLMLSDSSGAIFDAIHCQIPVILLDHARPNGGNVDKDSLEQARRGELGEIVTQPASLGSAVAEVLAQSVPDLQHLEPLRKSLFTGPQGAASEAGQVILKLAAGGHPKNQLQKSVLTEMRNYYQCRSELSTARSFSGFLGMTLNQIRQKFPSLKPAPAQPEPPVVAAGKQRPGENRTKKKSPNAKAKDGSIQIAFDAPPEELREILQNLGHQEDSADIRVSHGSDAAPETYLLRLARRNTYARSCVVELARAGYYTYRAKAGFTRFIRADTIKSRWSRILTGEYSVSADDLIHSFTPPLDGRATKHLLVVLSSIHIDLNQAGLERYFMQNYASIQKFIPVETAVLRIADLGGVMGAFYLNTVHRPDHTRAIHNLIRSIQERCGIDSDAVVLYGGSKGGTGALYQGLLGGFRFIAVDPITSDDHYHQHKNDPHFTAGGVFPETKEEVFAQLFKQTEETSSHGSIRGRSAVICSERSPQFPYITKTLIERFSDRMSFFNSRNPMIRDHQDVGPRTVNSATMLINMQLYGMELPCGIQSID